VITERGTARPGDPVIGGGVVTSGTFSPSLEVGIGMAYLPTARAVPGTEFEIDVRGKHRRARVETRPLLKV
jgi:aminomethyltransferase